MCPIYQFGYILTPFSASFDFIKITQYSEVQRDRIIKVYFNSNCWNISADLTAWEFQQPLSQYRTVLLINLQYLHEDDAIK